MKVLVTGGRGFIGARLVAHLLAEGADVRVLDDGSRGVAELPTAVEAIDGDVRDDRVVRAACRGIDVVAHLAAVQGTRTSTSARTPCSTSTSAACSTSPRRARRRASRRLVFSSSSEVYGIPDEFPTPETAPLVVPDPANPRWSYGASKIAGELVVVHTRAAHGFEYVILRYHNVYGPAMGWDHVVPQFISRLVARRGVHGAGRRQPAPVVLLRRRRGRRRRRPR